MLEKSSNTDACNRTVEAANRTKSTQLKPTITELITITIPTTTYPKIKTREFSKWMIFLLWT